jgi:hypothetical protein
MSQSILLTANEIWNDIKSDSAGARILFWLWSGAPGKVTESSTISLHQTAAHSPRISSNLHSFAWHPSYSSPLSGIDFFPRTLAHFFQLWLLSSGHSFLHTRDELYCPVLRAGHWTGYGHYSEWEVFSSGALRLKWDTEVQSVVILSYGIGCNRVRKPSLESRGREQYILIRKQGPETVRGKFYRKGDIWVI